MAFKVVFHGLDDAENLTKVQKSVAEFRAEKTIKALKKIGIHGDAIIEILHKDKDYLIDNMKSAV